MPVSILFLLNVQLRVLRIAKVWPAMNSFLLIIADSFSGLGNLIIIFIIVLYMFAVIGFQLFQEEYQTSDTISRYFFSTKSYGS